MTTTDHATTGSPDTITDFDSDGWPIFERDELDARYADLLDRMRDGAEQSWFTIDRAVGELLAPTGALAFADEVLEVAAALVQRERGRLRLMIAEQERRIEELRRGLAD